MTLLSFIDISVQKWKVLKVSGCIEHTGVFTQLIQEVWEGKRGLTVLWLDLTLLKIKGTLFCITTPLDNQLSTVLVLFLHRWHPGHITHLEAIQEPR